MGRRGMRDVCVKDINLVNTIVANGFEEAFTQPNPSYPGWRLHGHLPLHAEPWHHRGIREDELRVFCQPPVVYEPSHYARVRFMERGGSPTVCHLPGR